MNVLADTARYVAAALAAGVPAGVNVRSVTEPGYAQLVAPFVSVDAPRVVSFGQYLTDTPTAVVAVPMRVAGNNTADGVGLVELADAVLTTLHGAGLQIETVEPAVSAGEGTAAPLPVYRVTVQLTVRNQLEG